jgi:hypothetical protein
LKHFSHCAHDLKHFSHCAHEEISSLRGGPAAPNFGTGQVASAIKGRVVQAVAEEVAPEVAAEARVNVLWVVVVRAAAVDDVCNLHGRFVARICLGVVLHREAAMVAVERAEAATEWRAGAAMVEVEGSATVDGYISIATIRDVLATSDSAIVVRASASPASRL